jgi:hypothetical protein
MRFYQAQHAFYCGVDLHARKMFVSVVDDVGTLVEQRNLDAGPEPFLSLVRPYRAGLVVGCQCMFAWYWERRRFWDAVSRTARSNGSVRA